MIHEHGVGERLQRRSTSAARAISDVVAICAITFCVYGCQAVHPKTDATSQAQASASNGPSLDEQLAPILSSYAVRDPVLSDTDEAISRAVIQTLREPLQFRGLNKERSGDGVYVFVVNESALLLDAGVCGPTGQADDIPPEQRELCYRMSSIKDNCAAIATTTIACDFQLIWRLSREASLLALSSLKKPGVDEYWFPRDQLRRKFLAGEVKYPTTEKQLQNLRDIHDVFTNGVSATANEPRLRIQRGFALFLLSHETGHIVKGHTRGSALPFCAVSAEAPSKDLPYTLCQPVSSKEIEADSVALDVLAGDLTPNEFTPARAAPEFFVEEYERRQFLALVDVGEDPNTWVYDSASPDQQAKFQNAWLHRIGTGSHPKDLARYIKLLDLLESRGISLTDSLRKRAIAKAELQRLEGLCTAADINGNVLPSIRSTK